jgi:adenylate cyclase
MTAVTLESLRLCFEGAVPAVIATASAEGTPNITYLSRVHLVDHERVALSNQFFSKTARNLAENPRASVLLLDPVTYEEFRLRLVYERTERRGPVFERLRADIDALAALQRMEEVFKLQAADIYRVLDIEPVPTAAHRPGDPRRRDGRDDPGERAPALAELAGRLSRAGDLDAMLETTVAGLATLFGYEHSLVLLLDEDGRRLFTIASRGYEAEGVGSEVTVGQGLIGLAAARCAALRVGNLGQMDKYSRTVRRSYEDSGDIAPGHDLPVPGLPDAQSQLAVPAMAFGQLVGVLAVENRSVAAYTTEDEAALTVIAALVASAVESERSADGNEDERTPAAPATAEPDPSPTATAAHLRFFPVDGSTFLDGDYLIKGVAGRLLWALVGHHERDDRVDFTHREMRLDPSLELPPHRDNFENRLLLLKRRLDERDAPVRIEKTGRGRFRVHVTSPLRLESAER